MAPSPSDANRKSNLRALGPLWLYVLLLWAFLVMMFVLSAIGGGSMTLRLVLAVVGAVVVAIVIALRAQRKIQRYLREPTPDALLAHLERALRRVPVAGIEHTLPSTAASWWAVYGDFERARAELDARPSSGGPAYVEATRLQAAALIHYLSGQDVAHGLALARRAVEHVQMPRALPGARQSRASAASYVDLGRVLAEDAGPELCDALVARAAKRSSSLLDRLVSVWAAAVALTRAGRAGEAELQLARLWQLAPHCAPLHRVPASTPSPSDGGDAALLASARESEDADDRPCIRCRHRVHGHDAQRAAGGVICALCKEEAVAVRTRLLKVEGRIRALGLLVQIGTVSFALFMVVGSLALPGMPLAHAAASALYAAAIGTFFWLAGRSIRQLRSFPGFLLPTLVGPYMLMIPFGPLVGAYLLRLTLRTTGREVRSDAYRDVVAATPELSPASPRRFALQLVALWFACALGSLVLAVAITMALERG